MMKLVLELENRDLELNLNLLLKLGKNLMMLNSKLRLLESQKRPRFFITDGTARLNYVTEEISSFFLSRFIVVGVPAKSATFKSL